MNPSDEDEWFDEMERRYGSLDAAIREREESERQDLLVRELRQQRIQRAKDCVNSAVVFWIHLCWIGPLAGHLGLPALSVVATVAFIGCAAVSALVYLYDWVQPTDDP